MSSLKRSRDVDLDIPRIKYHVTQSGRAFERLLKDNSFAELQDAIRVKLELEPSAPLEMHRVQNDVKYDLEDEDDFAAMKAAAYATDLFDVHISLKKTKPAPKKVATPSRSRRVSIVLPKQKATDAPGTEQTSSEPTPTNEEAPAIEANPAPPKKRRKSISAGDSAPAGPSILKRKATADTNDDTPKGNDAEEPPKKKQKSDKAVKKKEEPSTSAKKQPTVAKRKSSTDKSQSPTESSESPEPPISNSKTVESQGRSSPAPSSLKKATQPKQKRDAVTSKPQSKPAKSVKKDEGSSKKQQPAAKRKPPVEADSSSEASEASDSSESPVEIFKNTQPKKDGNVKATKTQAKPTKPASRAAKPSPYAAQIAAMPPLLNYAQLKNRVADPKGNKRDNSGPVEPAQPSAKDKKSEKNAKKQQEQQEQTDNTDDPKSVDPPAQVDGKKKTEKSKKSVDGTKDKARDKPISIDTAKDKDKKGGSTDTTGPTAATDKGLAKHATAPSVFPNGQAKSVDTLVDEIETSIQSKKSNANSSKVDKDLPPQKTVAPQADSQRKSNIPVLPFHSKLKLSQVPVQSNDEGSESESSSSMSGSDSGSDSNSDGEDVVPNRKSSLAKTTPSLESESSRQSVNLDAVDLNALLLGPSVKSIVKSLSKLEEEGKVMDGEEKHEESGELEEEEEIETRHSIIPETARRLSTTTRSQAVDDEEDDDDESSSHASTSINPSKINPSVVKAVRDEGEIARKAETSGEGGNEDSVSESASPDGGDSPPTETALVSNEPDAGVGPSENAADKMEVEPRESSNSMSVAKPSSTPGPPADEPRSRTPPTPPNAPEPSTPAVGKGTFQTPGTVGRMKDRNGRRAAQDEVDVEATPVPATVRPARTIATRSRPTVDPEESATSRRTTRQMSALPLPEKRVLRSSKVPPPPSTPSKPTKAAKAKKTKEPPAAEALDTIVVVPRNQKRATGAASQETVLLGSQWQALPPIPSTPPSSSQLDELRSTATNHKEAAGDVLRPAVEISTSRRGTDEQDVENVVGGVSQEPDADTEFVPPRSPLFLPGASQLSPSQYRVESMGLEFGPPPDSLQEPSNSKPDRAEAGSETETDPESDKELLAVPKLSQPLKSMFPSLSELSFNKFRPSFLMGSRSQRSQGQSHAQTSSSKTATTTNNKSDSEDDDDDDDDDEDEDSSESEKGSHIPKNKRAGVGVVKRRKSRGLLR